MTVPAGRPVLLLGSVALPSAESVFVEVSNRIGALARSIPDGETGERLTWLGWQSQRLRDNPGVTVVDTMEFEGPQVKVTTSFFKLDDGVDPAHFEVKSLGYAEAAAESYAVFRTLRDQGVIGPDVRMQVSMPSAVGIAFLFGPQMHDVLPALEQAMSREVTRIAEAIPPNELAIQWDLAVEAQQEDGRVHPDRAAFPTTWPLEDAIASAARISASVPDQATLGFHLCYGDAAGKHMFEPLDLSMCVRIANALASAGSRRIDWIHVPIPIERDDDAYFAPLQNLTVGDSTQLYLGLVHLADGVDGARRRITAAERYRTDFGVAFECGLGRRDPASIPELLDLHRAVATM